jgi:hypothetical protein
MTSRDPNSGPTLTALGPGLKKSKKQSHTPKYTFDLAPRCGAFARTTGESCKSPAVRGRKRCRMHGGKNPGAPRGNKNALIHGSYTAEAIAERGEMARQCRELRLKEQEMAQQLREQKARLREFADDLSAKLDLYLAQQRREQAAAARAGRTTRAREQISEPTDARAGPQTSAPGEPSTPYRHFARDRKPKQD